MKIRQKIADLPLQHKLVVVYCVTTLLILCINIFMYANVNVMMQRLDEIYVSNINLNLLSDALDRVQDDMNNYLNTKTTDAMDGYYKSCQEYTVQIEELNDVITNSDLQRMEHNIKYMSQEYLSFTDSAIEAKRGRNVEKYKEYYEQASTLYQYISAYISNLNNKQFKDNSSNYTALSMSLSYLEIVNTVIFIVVAVINVIIVILVIRNITKPLKSLSEVANQVAGGNLGVDMLEVDAMDEVGVVSSAFNQMIVSIRNYIERLTTSMENERMLKERELTMETHLKDAQLKYLQAQINPHFLFNTLNAGAQLAMMEDADRTYNYIQNVSEFFRYNIKKDHDTVSLREELDLVDNYIYILNVRFSGEIHYEKEIDHSLDNLQVPSMILQPIMENSVNYGIRGISWEGRIELSVYENDGYACIRIYDNGIGISPEKVEKIMSTQLKKEDVKGDSNGIGLDNVIHRLKLFYGYENVFNIRSAGKNKGTEVFITIPLAERN